MKTGNVKSMLTNNYYRLARHWPVTRLHNALRRRKHSRRYGVDSAFMFMAVELELNSMCNRKCTYCPNVSSKRPVGFMSDELFRKIIGELEEIDFDGRISYHFYGEPLLDKRLPEFVQYTKERVPRAYTEIYSNGDFLDLPTYRDYLKRGLSNFLITQHDNVMTPALQDIMDNATEEEKRHITIRFAKDRYLINRSGLIEGFTKTKEPLKLACDWPLSIMVITEHGNVVLCCNDYFETEVVGNVVNHTLREVWTSPRFTHFREALARGDRTVSPLCHECDYSPSEERLDRIIPDSSYDRTVAVPPALGAAPPAPRKKPRRLEILNAKI